MTGCGEEDTSPPPPPPPPPFPPVSRDGPAGAGDAATPSTRKPTTWMGGAGACGAAEPCWSEEDRGRPVGGRPGSPGGSIVGRAGTPNFFSSSLNVNGGVRSQFILRFVRSAHARAATPPQMALRPLAWRVLAVNLDGEACIDLPMAGGDGGDGDDREKWGDSVASVRARPPPSSLGPPEELAWPDAGAVVSSRSSVCVLGGRSVCVCGRA
jgi:hypothetical protein